MTGQLLPRGAGRVPGRVGLQRGHHPGRRRRHVDAQQVVLHVLPAQRGRRGAEVRPERQERPGPQQPAARRAIGQARRLERVAHRREAVERRQLAVHERVTRGQQVAEIRRLVEHQPLDRRQHLRAHRMAQRRAHLREERAVLRQRVEPLQYEVLREEPGDGLARPRIVEEPLRRGAHPVHGGQRAPGRAREQRVVGRRAPQQIRQPRSHLVARVAQPRRVVGVGLAHLDPEQEVRRLQHPGHRELQPAPRIPQQLTDLRGERHPGVELLGGERSAPRLLPEARQEDPSAARVRRVAAHERLAPRERLLRQRDRRRLVLLRGQRPDRELGRPDGREAVQRGVRLEVVRQHHVAQQAADRGGVLGPRQPMQRGGRRLERGQLLARDAHRRGLGVVRVAGLVGGLVRRGGGGVPRGRDGLGLQRRLAAEQQQKTEREAHAREGIRRSRPSRPVRRRSRSSRRPRRHRR